MLTTLTCCLTQKFFDFQPNLNFNFKILNKIKPTDSGISHLWSSNLCDCIRSKRFKKSCAYKKNSIRFLKQKKIDLVFKLSGTHWHGWKCWKHSRFFATCYRNITISFISLITVQVTICWISSKKNYKNFITMKKKAKVKKN